jgi:trk system potassium uptake protein TrkH
LIALRPILSVLGFLYAGLAAAMLVPAMVDVATKNADWQAFVFSSFLTGLAGTLLAIAVRGTLRKGLNMRQTFLLTVLAWITLPAFGSLPFLWLGIGYADAMFEAVSGFTTTGSTVLEGLDSLPPGLLVWRSMLQWMGGVGIAVMAVILLPFLRVGGMQLFQTESAERTEKIVSRSVQHIRLIAGCYLLLTFVCALAYATAGLDAFEAVNHAMSTVATGGFSTRDASFAAFAGSPAAVWVCILFMILGALPFVLIIQAMRGRPLQLWTDPQVRAFLVFLAVVTLGLTVHLGSTQGMPFHEALRDSAFTVVSITSTTGYVLTDYEAWGSAVAGLALMLCFIGGCTGSTCGGIKIFRYQVFFGTVRSHLRKMTRPNRVTPEFFGRTRLTPELSFSVLSYLIVYIGAVGLVTLALAVFDLDAMTSLSAAASAIANIGPGLGSIVGPGGSYASLPDGAKWVLSAAMLLGRLELLTVLVLLDRDFWAN